MCLEQLHILFGILFALVRSALHFILSQMIVTPRGSMSHSLIKRTDVNSDLTWLSASVASGSIIASIVSFNSSIEIGFCSTACPRKRPARSVTGDENYRSLPSLQEMRNRINAIAVDADVEDREVELGYHRESARIANCGGSRNDAMTEFLNHSRYGLATL
jgi:hypothetical protein